MALYLDEVWLKDPISGTDERICPHDRRGGEKPRFDWRPAEVRFVGGPWASNEEPKVIFLVDIPNHTPTYQIFGKLVSTGLVEKRRLTPIVEWSEVEKMASQL